MLAGTVEDVTKFDWSKGGYIVSPKIDGIRALTIGGKLLSRSLKPIPNRHIRETLEAICPQGLDGELLSGETFQDCTSAIMSHEGEPEFAFCAFDYLGLGLLAPYRDRIDALAEVVAEIGDPRVQAVPTFWVDGPEQLTIAEEEALARGFEGLMLRRPEGPYKEGRSTLREGWLLKLKRFTDSEAIVVGFEELMRNENEAKVNELGRTKRSSAKEGLVPAGTLGSLRLQRPDGVEFGIGAGLTEAMRSKVWAERDRYLGSTVKYKSQKFGEKDAPRLPVFLGFRAPEDR